MSADATDALARAQRALFRRGATPDLPHVWEAHPGWAEQMVAALAAEGYAVVPIEVWARLELGCGGAEPGFNEALRKGEQDIAEGRGTPFRDIAQAAEAADREPDPEAVRQTWERLAEIGRNAQSYPSAAADPLDVEALAQAVHGDCETHWREVAEADPGRQMTMLRPALRSFVQHGWDAHLPAAERHAAAYADAIRKRGGA